MLGATVKRVYMQGHLVVAGFHHRAGAAFVRGTARTHLGFAHHAALRIKRAFAGDAVVNHVHHAAHRTAAVKQSRWAAQHFNALGGERVNGHGVV